MLSILRNRTCRRLFTAQIVALTGTGPATVVLALLAYDLAGADAGSVLGTAHSSPSRTAAGCSRIHWPDGSARWPGFGPRCSP